MDSFPDVPFPHKIFDPVARLLARVGDDVILPIYRRPDMAVEIKPDHTPVTEADGKAEIALRKELAEMYPGAGFIGEETDGGDWRQSPMLHEENGLWVTDRDRTVFIMDPVDGTINFSMGPKAGRHFASMIARFDLGEFVASYIYFPLSRDFLFTAATGPSFWVGLGNDGAFTEPRALRVPPVSPDRPKRMQFFFYGEHKDPIRHTEMGETRFGPLVAPDGKLEFMTCIAETLRMMALDGSVDMGACPSYITPWDEWTTGPVFEHSGAVVLSETGGDYRAVASRGIVIGRDRKTAESLLNALSPPHVSTSSHA